MKMKDNNLTNVSKIIWITSLSECFGMVTNTVCLNLVNIRFGKILPNLGGVACWIGRSPWDPSPTIQVQG